MTGWRIGWLLGVFLLVGCAERNAGVMSKEQAREAARPWVDCILTKADVMDDGSATVAVLANAVLAECHRLWLGTSDEERRLVVQAVEGIRTIKREEPSAKRGFASAALGQKSTSTSSTLMKKTRGIYVVPVTINNAITLDFAVDSGASDVTIPADVVLTLMRAGTIRSTDFIGEKTYVLADGTRTKSRTFRIRSLMVGDRIVQDVVGSVAPTSGTLLLGQSFLGRFKSWSIDNSRHALVLE
jgi:clan AA aspartic protease (TIGR02281 family)